MRAIRRNGYQLLIGENSTELFNYFGVNELHGLSKSKSEQYTDTPESAYIRGMSNLSPKNPNGLPYVFFNKKRLNGTYRDVTNLMHEYLHLSRILFKDINDDNEEEIVQFIEDEVNWIIDNGVIGIFEQPSTKYM